MSTPETPTVGPDDLTPVVERDGLLYKREDAYRLPNGVNGSKLRACRHLLIQAKARGARAVVSASSVLSPQSAMAATLARSLNLPIRVIVGGTTVDKAIAHPAIHLAAEQGAELDAIAVGYNPALQSAARKYAETHPGVFHLPYGITTPDDADASDIHDFLLVGAPQTKNLPEGVETVILPFGSGNTAAAVLLGLTAIHRPDTLRRVILMGIGPDRQKWLRDRLARVGVTLDRLPFEIHHLPLHPEFATYGDRMPETQDGIRFHPTYEGKIVRYLNRERPDYWTRRDGTTLMWIVGGPIDASTR